jgi:hypothetical protein
MVGILNPLAALLTIDGQSQEIAYGPFGYILSHVEAVDQPFKFAGQDGL